MSLTPSDILKTALVCAATIVAVLLWVHRSKQTIVPRSWQASRNIALRIFVLHTVGLFCLCEVLKVPVNILLIALPFVYLMCFVTPEGAPPPTDRVGFAMILIFILPFFAMQQFVLGFPVLRGAMLEPPSAPRNPEPPPLACDIGVVVAMLRPMGNVELGSERFSAVSVDGKMLEVGTPIRVCGNRGNVLVVIRHDSEEAQSHA